MPGGAKRRPSFFVSSGRFSDYSTKIVPEREVLHDKQCYCRALREFRPLLPLHCRWRFVGHIIYDPRHGGHFARYTPRDLSQQVIRERDNFRRHKVGRRYRPKRYCVAVRTDVAFDADRSRVGQHREILAGAYA